MSPPIDAEIVTIHIPHIINTHTPLCVIIRNTSTPLNHMNCIPAAKSAPEINVLIFNLLGMDNSVM